MNFTFSDYFVGVIAISMVTYDLIKYRRNDYKVIYKEVISTASFIAYAMAIINGGFNNDTPFGFLASAGISFIIASVGLVIIETVLSFRLNRNEVSDYAVAIDTSVRWVVVAVGVIYMINIVYDAFMQGGGTRVDLLLADTIGLCLAIVCLEKARLQLHTKTIASPAEPV